MVDADLRRYCPAGRFSDFALMSGELARLLDDLVEALGGELPAA